MTQNALHILKEKSQPPKDRMDAILSIVNEFEPSHIPIFEAILQDESEHPDVRSGVALALGKVGHNTPEYANIPTILLTHVRSNNIIVRNHVIQALGMLGSELGIPPLIEALKDEDNTIFSSAAEALGEIGRPIVPYMIELLKQGRDDARCVAAWQLGEVRGTMAIEPLIESVREEQNLEVKALAIWALGEMGMSNPTITEVLNWAKHHEAPEINERAQIALKKIARHAN